MKDFRGLTGWEKAQALTLMTYKITQCFPGDERFGLTSQMRRSSASIATNIAEGCGRQGNAEFERFLQLAIGSATELDYQISLSRDLGYLVSQAHAEMESRVLEVKRMLSTFIRGSNYIGPEPQQRALRLRMTLAGDSANGKSYWKSYRDVEDESHLPATRNS